MNPARKYRLRLARYYLLAETIATYANLKPTGEKTLLLDVGVGRGRSKICLETMDIKNPIEFYGIDISNDRLELVYKKEEWNLQKCDIEDGLPFTGEYFDVAICEQVLEHIKKPDFALAEMTRVLRPGGLLIIGVPIFPPVMYHLRKFIQPGYDRYFGIERNHVQTFCLSSITRHIANIPQLIIVTKRGFRFISGGAISFLENYRWWWKLNVVLGSLFPAFTIETQIIARKKTNQ